MLFLDSVTNLALSVDDVCRLDASRVSSTEMFRIFAAGFHVGEDFVLNDRWSHLPKLKSVSAMYGVVMQEMLPVCYDAAQLEGFGGHFSIRITDVCDYTLIAVNRRVVVLVGLPFDVQQGAETIDLEIAPEVLMAFCRGLLLDVADNVLVEEDELEDREISGIELLLNGMPSGGYSAGERSGGDIGSSLSSVGVGNIGFLNVNDIVAGTISSTSDQDWFAVGLDRGVTYTINLRGAPSGSGTLADPYLRGIYDASGALVHSGNDDFPDAYGNRESCIYFTPATSGAYYISAGAYGGYQGTYRLAVSGPSSTTVLLPSNELANDFGSTLEQARILSVGALGLNGVAQGSVAINGDQDWYAVSLNAGTTYRFDLRGATSGSGTLYDPYLRGIYNTAGSLVHSGNDDFGGTLESHIDFTPSTSGTYFVSAGAYGSNVGTYRIYLNGFQTTNATLPSMESSYDFGSSLAYAQSASTGGINVNGYAQGWVGYAGDQDWYAVNLSAGSAYTINLRGAGSRQGTLPDTFLRGIYDSSGNMVGGWDDDSGGSLESRSVFVPTTSGVYYISAGAYGNNTGSYTLSITGAAPVASNTEPRSNIFACGTAAAQMTTSTTAYGGAGSCGINTVVLTGAVPSHSGGACGVRSLAMGWNACGTNLLYCGANMLSLDYNLCAIDVNACAMRVGQGLFGTTSYFGCGVNLQACGAQASILPAGACGYNWNACRMRVGLDFCGGYMVACGVDLSFGLDVGTCNVNVFPLVPSL